MNSCKWCAALDGMRVDRLCKGFDTILTTLEIKLKCQKQAKIQELIDLN